MSATNRATMPTAAEVVALAESDRRVAPPEWEDGNGHVNVLHYYGFHMDAASQALAAMGWTEDYRERTGCSVFSVEQHIRFHDEVLVGHDVSAHFRLLDRNAKMIHAVSVLVNRTTMRVANTVEVVEAHVDLRTRRASPFPPEMTGPLDRHLEAHRTLAWQVPLNTGMGLR